MVVTNRVALVVSMVCFSGACYESADIGPDVVSSRNEEFNAEVLNGPVIQGPVIQGTVLQGVILNGPVIQGPVIQGPVIQGPVIQSPVLQGVVLNGPVIQGPVIQGPVIQGSLFSGVVIVNGEEVPVSGTDFIGSEWEVRIGQVIDGQDVYETYILRFDDIHVSEEQDDVYLYDIVHRPKDGGEWKSLCNDSQGSPVAAIPMQNYWNLETGDRIDDANVITFACTNAVLAKCALWGYRPWATANRCEKYKQGKDCADMPLTDYHQACTRMARADYCGNGEPWTVQGHAIDLWDHLNPQIQTPTTDWFIEAEWTPDGAYCLNDIRLQELKEQGLYPECFKGKKGKPIKIGDCGSLKKHRALITSTFEMPEDANECHGNGH